MKCEVIKGFVYRVKTEVMSDTSYDAPYWMKTKAEISINVWDDLCSMSCLTFEIPFHMAETFRKNIGKEIKVILETDD